MAKMKMDAVVKHRFKPPTGKSHVKILVLPDVHDAPDTDTQGGADPYAWSVAMQAAQIYKPDAMVVIGDFMECTSVNSYQWSKKKRPPLEFGDRRAAQPRDAEQADIVGAQTFHQPVV